MTHSASWLTRPYRIGLAWIAIFVLFVVNVRPSLAVRYGEVLTPDRYNNVGLVIVSNERYPFTGIGTGTLITPNIVLTAGHVIDGARMPQCIRFHLDGRPQQASVIAYRVVPGYKRSLASNTSTKDRDIAILRLDRDMPSDLDYTSISEKRGYVENELGIAVGYGRDATRKLNIRSMGRLKYYKQSKAQTLLFVPADDKNQITDAGDSGGPIFRTREDGKLEIMAVVQGLFYVEPEEAKSLKYDAIDIGGYVSIDRHRDWIKQTIQELSTLPVVAGAKPPRYLAVKAQKQQEMPLTYQQLIKFVELKQPEKKLIEALERGFAEPFDERAKQILIKGKVPQGVINYIDRKTESQLTIEQVLALIKINADPTSIRDYVWVRGGFHGDWNKAIKTRLINAGAGSKLLEWLKRSEAPKFGSG